MSALIASAWIFGLSWGLIQEPSSGPEVDDGLITAALERAAENRGEIERALEWAPGATERRAIRYLVGHMPASDLRSLSAAFLIDDVALACAARDAAPWALPDDVFLDAVLPYANVTETREGWRARLREISLPLVGDAATPGDAAQRLNARLFSELGVRYSTERARPDQCPSETIDSGVASCTGLSILLVDACRSVGVPARLVGIARWPHKRGNHTWVEVWDGERWRFTGAAEQDPAGLDRGWFVTDAALARSDEPQHAIHAVQWRRTGTRFPVVWARDAEVHAIDVTSRYTASTATDGRTRLGVDVLRAGQRVVATVDLLEVGAAAPSATGHSKDRHADRNDHLEFRLEPGRHYRVRVTAAGQRKEVAVERGDERFQILTVELRDEAEDALRRAAERYFGASATERAAIAFPVAADDVVRDDEERARAIVTDAWRRSSVHAKARADFEAGVVRSADREARYSSETIGERPSTGYALVIAMHGGGGVPPEVNDRQWEVMKRYYRPRPDAGGYRYVALRAPNDEWNGFYDDAIGPLIVELIRQHVLFAHVDPDRVFAIGYSHGGYGAFVIGPKLADRFAAVHASAAAPTPGETLAINLRNLRFSFMVGSKDRAYERILRCDAFATEVAALHEADPDGYRVRFDRIEGHGHGGLPDRDQLAALLPIVRDPVPRTLAWAPSDARIHDHFWLHAPSAADGQTFRARVVDGVIELETSAGGGFAVGIDRRLIGERDTITIRHAGRARALRYHPTARGLVESLARRGDPRLAFPMWVEVGA